MVEKNKYIPITQIQDEVGPNQWLNDLRKEYGSCFYAIDPYVEVFKVRDNVWAMLAPCTHAVGDNWIYLVEGPEKAIFIDNGYGVGNLRGLGEMLTGKPCVTGPTHYHGDHAQGSAQFDEIYAHKYCAEMMKTLMSREAWDRFNHKGEAQYRPYFLEEDILPNFVCEPIACENHHIINLGGDYDIEMIHVGGHAPGETCYLDKKGRMLYTGDAYFYSIDEMPALGTGLSGGVGRPGTVHPECMSFEFYGEQTELLAARSDEFDYIMPGHGPILGPGSIVENTRDAMRIAIENPENYNEVVETIRGESYNVRVGYARVRYGKAFLELHREKKAKTE